MSSRFLDPSAVRRIAAELDLRPSKQRGQNFVVDANTVRRIVALAEVTSADVVCEVGPGLGSLTLGLLDVGARVIAIEIEPALGAQLPATVLDHQPDAIERLRVITADALDVREVSDPQPSAVVANLPYNVAVPVILHLLEHFPAWERGLVMVQSEVAQRLAAAPGSKVYGVPSAKVAWYADCETVGLVSAKVFWPVPNVASELVGLRRRPAPVTTATRQQVFTVIDAAFAQRRKMLRGALGALFGSAAAAEAALVRAGVDPTARGEVLDIAAFARIAEQLL